MIMVDHVQPPGSKRPRDASHDTRYCAEVLEMRSRGHTAPAANVGSDQFWHTVQHSKSSEPQQSAKETRDPWLEGDALGGRGLQSHESEDKPLVSRARALDVRTLLDARCTMHTLRTAASRTVYRPQARSAPAAAPATASPLTVCQLLISQQDLWGSSFSPLRGNRDISPSRNFSLDSWSGDDQGVIAGSIPNSGALFHP
jgi:hypothetical protein